MDVLTIGASGLLGGNVVTEGLARGHTVEGTFRSNNPELDVELVECNLRERETIGSLVKRISPDAVINCAAMTDVDECERRPDVAREVNATAPGMLAEICFKRGIQFIHVSTDYIFDGQHKEPYTETANPNPLQVYGKTKLEGERLVSEANNDALIVRLSFVYGVDRARETLEGFPAWVRDRLMSGDDVPLFTDQHVTPTRAGHAASTMFDLVANRASGKVHVASRSCVTPYQFGEKIVNQMGTTASFVETSRTDIERDAPRPGYTCLDVNTVESLLERHQPTLVEDLRSIGSYFS